MHKLKVLTETIVTLTLAFTLTIYSPDNQTYTSVMPLNFSIDWTEYPTFQLPIPPAPILYAVYNYTIDNNPPVTVTSNQSSSDVLGYSNFLVNPTFSYLVNVSNLTNGYHKIVITATLYGYIGGYLFFGASSSPVQFLVQNPTPSPTPTPTSTVSPTASPSPSPTIPEFPTWIILPLFAAIILLSMVFIKKRHLR